MSDRVSELISQMRVAADGSARTGAAGHGDREKLKQLAAQFEATLLVQMLRGMRESGKWDDDGSAESDGLGGSALFEMIDVELANQLSATKGLGLSQQLLQALEKIVPAAAESKPADAVQAPAVTATPALPDSKSPVVPGVSSTPQFSVAPGSVTSDFGWRRDPFTGHAKFHRGIDVKAAYGQDIQSAGAGKVVFSGEQRGYGTTVVVEHGDGVRTRYAHLSAAHVQEGDRVSSGQALGRAGRSGRATGTHLHFEVTANGRPVNPADWGLRAPHEATNGD